MRQRISDVNQKTGYPVRYILSIACGTRMNSGDREKVRPYLAMRKEKGKLPQRRGGAEDDRERNLIEAAIAVHRKLGPGLLETVYEVALARALERRGLHVERQVAVPIEYEGERFAEGFRADLIVEGKVLLELKSVERVTPAHKKQLLTYLRLTGLKLGYLLNFGEALMKDGITRTINGRLEVQSL
jgi:GxxExxY protein